MVDTFTTGNFGHRQSGSNMDLWHGLAKALEEVEQCMRLRVGKVKGHLEAEHVALGLVSLEDFLGNALADALADNAADRVQLPEHVTMAIQLQDSMMRQNPEGEYDLEFESSLKAVISEPVKNSLSSTSLHGLASSLVGLIPGVSTPLESESLRAFTRISTAWS